jgi:hypothetical protein
MGASPQQQNENPASDAFNFMAPREPIPRMPQMESRPAQIAAGVYNGAVAPTMDFMASPMGLATSAVPFAGQIPARLTQIAFVPSLAKGAYESGKQAQEAFNDPKATTQDVATAASAAVGQGAGALMGFGNGALNSGAGKYIKGKGEMGSVGSTGFGEKSRAKQSEEAIDAGLSEKPTLAQQYPTSEQGFYSQLQRVIDEKMPNSASVQQIKAIIDPEKGSGVKPDEIKWSNLEGFLEGREKVTKQEVLDHLRNEGAVKFEEVELGEVSSRKARDEYEELRYEELENYKKRTQLSEKSYQANKDGDYDSAKKYDEEFARLLDRSREIEKLKEEGQKNAYIDPKYSQYVLPNGENYREVVLTMPSRKITPEALNAKSLANLGKPFDELTSAQQKAIKGIVEFGDTEKENIKNRLETYTSSHYQDIPNYVAHMRLNDRTDADGKGTFMEELQSDRHQQGREEGYKGEMESPWEYGIYKDGAIHSRFKTKSELDDYEARYGQQLRQGFPNSVITSEKLRPEDQPAENLNTKVPDAPFRKDWHTQLFKRALQDAVNKGHDWIGWTKGETQFGRWGSQKFDWQKQSNGSWLMSGKEQFRGNAGGIDMEQTARERGHLLEEEGTIVNTYEDVLDLVRRNTREGKAEPVADKLWKRMQTESSGTSLPRKEGMEAFYDSSGEFGGMVKEIGKYVKKWGGKVEEGDMKTDPNEYDTTPIWKVKITPEMRKAIQHGQPQVNKDTDIFAGLA